MSNSPRRGRTRRTPARSTAARPDFARAIADDFAALGSPLELEQWTSGLLGQLWEQRAAVASEVSDDPMRVLGMSLVLSLRKMGGRVGKTVLGAIARLDHGPLGLCAGSAAMSLSAEERPNWTTHVGVSRIVRAFSAVSSPGGEALALEAEPVAGTPHMLVAFIDDQLGGTAKHLALIRSIDPTSDSFGDEQGLRFREVDPVLACGRVRQAIELTDQRIDAPVGDQFAYYRALAIARTRLTPARAPRRVPAERP